MKYGFIDAGKSRGKRTDAGRRQKKEKIHIKEKTDAVIYGKGMIKGFFKGGILFFLFYRSGIFLLAGGVLYGVIAGFSEKKKEKGKRQKEITIQFKEGLQSISSALSAGYSIENTFAQAQKDLILLYGPEAVLVKEFQWICLQLELNRPVEEVLFDFSKRWETEEIVHFAEVFQTAKRTGGNLIAITHSTAEKIGQKIEVKREIDTIIAGKKMEGRIMNFIPLLMILYFWICSPGFLDCFYQGNGRVVSTFLLIGYLSAFIWSEKISSIAV